MNHEGAVCQIDVPFHAVMLEWISFGEPSSFSSSAYDHRSKYLIIIVISVLRSVAEKIVGNREREREKKKKKKKKRKSTSGLTPWRWRSLEKGPGQPQGLVYSRRWWCGRRKCLTLASPALNLLVFQVVATSSTAWYESQVMASNTCRAVCDLVQHGEASNMPMLLKSWPLRYFQHFLRTSGVMVPVEGEASSFALSHFNPANADLGVGVPNTGGVLKNKPNHCLVVTFLDLLWAYLQVSPQEPKHLICV